MSEKHASDWRQTLAALADRRLLAIFWLGICSGFPAILTGSILSRWLQDEGYALSEIGLFSLASLAFTFNFLWAPILDRFRVYPFRQLGRRKSWLLAAQLVVLIGCIGMSVYQPAAGALPIVILAVVISIAAATQDIAIDAYRISLIDRSEQQAMAYAASFATAGWWTGFSFVGGLVFSYREPLGLSWGETYPYMAAVWLLLLVGAQLVMTRDTLAVQSSSAPVLRKLADTVISPFSDFFKRSGLKLGIALLLFVLTFKIGEAFLGKMALNFYHEVGYSDEEIGQYSKLVGWFVTILFSLLGGLVNARFGVIRGMVVGGIAMAMSNLMFSWIAIAGPSVALLSASVIVDGFTTAFSTVAFVSFISWFCSQEFSATQYALLASIGTAGRNALAGGSGFLVEALEHDWALFFALTAAMVIPSLLLLVLVIRPQINKRRSHYEPVAVSE